LTVLIESFRVENLDFRGSRCTVTADVATFLEEITPDVRLILLDLMMPATDGIEVLRLLSDRKCLVPIVLMSGVGNRILETAEQLAQSLGLSGRV
jgi:DNA-binding response OmpR family regulator